MAAGSWPDRDEDLHYGVVGALTPGSRAEWQDAGSLTLRSPAPNDYVFYRSEGDILGRVPPLILDGMFGAIQPEHRLPVASPSVCRRSRPEARWP
jgi:hypothetical protein